MATTEDSIRKARGLKFNAYRRVYLPGATLELLTISDETTGYTTIATLDADWYLKFAEYRNPLKLQIAKDVDFGYLIRPATHVRVLDIVYTIEKADTVPPLGENPVWTVFCRKFDQKRYASL